MKVIIVGGGTVGIYLAALLVEQGHEVVVIEKRENRIEVLEKELPHCQILYGSGSDITKLEEAGIRKAHVVAAVTGHDEVNLVVATLAKMEYGVSRVIGRINNPKNAWLYSPTMGVDAALNQADLMAHLVVEEMTMGDMMMLLKLHGGQHSLVEEIISSRSPAAGKALRDVSLPEECIIVLIIQGQNLCVPNGDSILQGGDKVVLMARNDTLKGLANLFDPRG